MRKLLIAVSLLGSLAACDKSQLKTTASPVAEETHQATSPSTKMANTKKWFKCIIKDKDGKVLASGDQCTGQGNECGRQDYCWAGGFGAIEAEEVIFEGMTRKEFADTWNTESGRVMLESRGVYAKLAE